MSDYPILLSTVLMIGALLIGRKLIFSIKAPMNIAERVARALLVLGLLVCASIPGAGESVWQTWTGAILLVAAAMFGFVAFLQRGRPELPDGHH
ncbi:MAG: hypothetical protein IBJ03_16410 [Gemmatimonadaceae bacterium]|nr:hypothetical protein [Gemmatimonadaceae bacterium]